MIHDRQPVAEHLRLLHVVRRQQDRLALARGGRRRGPRANGGRRGPGPCVGSSRKTISGSLTSASATDSRCCWPPERSLTARLRFSPRSSASMSCVVGRRRADRSCAKRSMSSSTVRLREEGRGLELDADALLDPLGVAARRRRPSTVSSPRVGLAQALEHLDRRRLARAVGPEQAEDLAAADLEADAVDRLHVAVRLAHVVDADDGLGVRHRPDRLAAVGGLDHRRLHGSPLGGDEPDGDDQERRQGRPGRRAAAPGAAAGAAPRAAGGRRRWRRRRRRRRASRMPSTAVDDAQGDADEGADRVPRRRRGPAGSATVRRLPPPSRASVVMLMPSAKSWTMTARPTTMPTSALASKPRPMATPSRLEWTTSPSGPMMPIAAVLGWPVGVLVRQVRGRRPARARARSSSGGRTTRRRRRAGSRPARRRRPRAPVSCELGPARAPRAAGRPARSRRGCPAEKAITGCSRWRRRKTAKPPRNVLTTGRSAKTMTSGLTPWRPRQLGQRSVELETVTFDGVARRSLDGGRDRPQVAVVHVGRPSADACTRRGGGGSVGRRRRRARRRAGRGAR